MGPPINKRKKFWGESRPQCLICCDTIRVYRKLRNPPTPPVAEILSDVYRSFCKNMSWGKIRPKYKFNFSSEYFPFCNSCKLDLVRIYKLDKQVEDVLKRVSGVTMTLSAKIIETEMEKIPNISKDKSLDNTGVVPVPSEEEEKKRCYLNKIRYYRDITFRRFCPFVHMTKTNTLPTSDDIKLILTSREDSGQIDKPGLESLTNAKNTTFLSCLICCEYVELYDYPSKSSSVAKILSNLFHVFCNYMQWEAKRRCLLNFKFESFPFCKHCRSKLVRIYKLDEKFQTLFKQLKNITRSISLKISKSEQNELFRTITRKYRQGQVKLMYNAEKVEYHRSLAFERHRWVDLNEKDTLSDSENEEKSDYLPTSSSEDSSASSDSESVSSCSDSDEVKEEELSQKRCKIRNWLLKSWKYRSRISAEGKFGFYFDKKIRFELNIECRWVCNYCFKHIGLGTKNLFAHLTNHLKDTKPSEATSSKSSKIQGPALDTQRGKRNKIVQVSPDKFEYGGCYFKKLSFKELQCSWCPYATTVFQHIAKHLFYTHQLHSNNPDVYINHFLRDNVKFQCYHCHYISKSQASICQHLRKRHFVQTISQTKSTTIKMDPNSTLNVSRENGSNIVSNPLPYVEPTPVCSNPREVMSLKNDAMNVAFGKGSNISSNLLSATPLYNNPREVIMRLKNDAMNSRVEKESSVGLNLLQTTSLNNPREVMTSLKSEAKNVSLEKGNNIGSNRVSTTPLYNNPREFLTRLKNGAMNVSPEKGSHIRLNHLYITPNFNKNNLPEVTSLNNDAVNASLEKRNQIGLNHLYITPMYNNHPEATITSLKSDTMNVSLEKQSHIGWNQLYKTPLYNNPAEIMRVKNEGVHNIEIKKEAATNETVTAPLPLKTKKSPEVIYLD